MSDRNSLAALINAPTRRQAIVGLAAAFGGLVLGSTRAWAGTEAAISHTAESTDLRPGLGGMPGRTQLHDCRNCFASVSAS